MAPTTGDVLGVVTFVDPDGLQGQWDHVLVVADGKLASLVVGYRLRSPYLSSNVPILLHSLYKTDNECLCHLLVAPETLRKKVLPYAVASKLDEGGAP